MKALMESVFPCWKRFEVEYEEFMVPLEDGVKLFTQLYLPEAGFKGPVIVIRSPYEKDCPNPEMYTGFIAEFLRAGFALVYQHCRGTGKSEGEFFPYLNERADGLELLEWIRQQPFYAKEIFLSGGSYLSSVHYAYLNAIGDDVKGAILDVQECKRYNILYRNGIFKCGLHGSWGASMYRKKQILRKSFSADAFRIMPLTAFPKAVFGDESEFVAAEFSHPDPQDSYWDSPAGGGEYAKALENLRIPILFTTGFYDIYTEGVLDMWESLSPESRSRCALVVTPFDHNYRGVGTTTLTYENGKIEEIWPNYKVEWYKAIRENRAPDFVTLGNITWHAQHEGVWRTAPHLENGKKELVFHLNDHTLDSEAAGEEKITYTYNPYAPAEFKGGCCNNFGGQQLQGRADSRYDIISFVSDPLERDVVFQGTSKVLLKVASDCEDTCFYARLSYINSDGECYCMRDDILPVSKQYPDYTPGEAVELELNFAPNAFKLAKGEKLRLDISSSCWPYFLPHRNKKGNYWEMETAAIARNTIFTGSSKLILLER